MTKYIVLSVNESPQYCFYLPLTVWAWRRFGFEPIVFYTHETNGLILAHKYIKINFSHKLNVEDYKSETVAQISRLYAACLYGHDNDMIMTGDVDMLPLSNYWNLEQDKINIFGWDLTIFQHIPICYIAMKRTRWMEVMGLTSHLYNTMIKRDLDSMPNAKSTEFEKWWSVDQQLITDRINAVQFEKNIVYRGSGPNGYPIGRVDRSAWTLDHTELIDCHMMRNIYTNPDNLAKTMLLLYKAFPNDNFDWFTQYVEEYKQLQNA